MPEDDCGCAHWGGPIAGFDLHRAGERFAVAAVLGDDGSTESRVVFMFNAFDEARRLTATSSST